MILALLWSCAGRGPADDTADATVAACADAPQGVTWDTFAHAFFTNYCVSCHSAANADHRNGAPTSVNFDSEADVVALADRVRVRVLEEGTMPQAGGVYAEDLALLDVWLRCTVGE